MPQARSHGVENDIYTNTELHPNHTMFPGDQNSQTATQQHSVIAMREPKFTKRNGSLSSSNMVGIWRSMTHLRPAFLRIRRHIAASTRTRTPSVHFQLRTLNFHVFNVIHLSFNHVTLRTGQILNRPGSEYTTHIAYMISTTCPIEAPDTYLIEWKCSGRDQTGVNEVAGENKDVARVTQSIHDRCLHLGHEVCTSRGMRYLPSISRSDVHLT